jgi:hypothetical protein
MLHDGTRPSEPWRSSCPGLTPSSTRFAPRSTSFVSVRPYHPQAGTGRAGGGRDGAPAVRREKPVSRAGRARGDPNPGRGPSRARPSTSRAGARGRGSPIRSTLARSYHGLAGIQGGQAGRLPAGRMAWRHSSVHTDRMAACCVQQVGKPGGRGNSRGGHRVEDHGADGDHHRAWLEARPVQEARPPHLSARCHGNDRGQWTLSVALLPRRPQLVGSQVACFDLAFPAGRAQGKITGCRKYNERDVDAAVVAEHLN